jgi:N-acyl amino acid synthase of PEP-CTERM/exosortase system
MKMPSFSKFQHANTRSLAGVEPLSDGRDGARLRDIYDSYFDIVLAETDEQRRAAFRLRYEVYCVEHAYEDPEENPGGMETDAYDSVALHTLLTHRLSGNLVGTVRLILPRRGKDHVSLPIRDVCHQQVMIQDNPALPWSHTAEISRFAISKNFRRRANEETSVGSFTTPGDDPRRMIPNTSLGLMQAIVMMAAKAKVTHLCAVMEPTLLRMLRRLGICFIPVGPPVDYHGRRQPCYSDLDVLLTRIWVERTDVWELITRDGGLWPLNTELAASLRAEIAQNSRTTPPAL